MTQPRFGRMKAGIIAAALSATVLAGSWFYMNQSGSASTTATTSGATQASGTKPTATATLGLVLSCVSQLNHKFFDAHPRDPSLSPRLVLPTTQAGRR